jgi:hypothetical protein
MIEVHPWVPAGPLIFLYVAPVVEVVIDYYVVLAGVAAPRANLNRYSFAFHTTFLIFICVHYISGAALCLA